MQKEKVNWEYLVLVIIACILSVLDAFEYPYIFPQIFRIFPILILGFLILEHNKKIWYKNERFN